MPPTTIRRYKQGSIIYFEGDKSESVYVLQQGQVKLIYTPLESGQEEEEDKIQIGGFFGIKSALGSFPREATAQTIMDSSVIVLTPEAFKSLCMKNTTLMVRLLKEFSAQLRTVHKKVQHKLGELELEDNSQQFFGMGKYYYTHEQFPIAKYVFQSFIKNYPDTPLTEQANLMLQALDNDISYTDPEKLPGDSDLVVTDAPAQNQEEKNEEDSANETHAEIETLYYNALNNFSQDKIEDTIIILKKIIDTPPPYDLKIQDYVEKARFQLCACYYKLKDMDKGLQMGKDFIKQYPNSQFLKKTLIFIAEIFELQKDVPRAIAIYNKVIGIPPKDQETIKAQNKVNILV